MDLYLSKPAFVGQMKSLPPLTDCLKHSVNPEPQLPSVSAVSTPGATPRQTSDKGYYDPVRDQFIFELPSCSPPLRAASADLIHRNISSYPTSRCSQSLTQSPQPRASGLSFVRPSWQTLLPRDYTTNTCTPVSFQIAQPNLYSFQSSQPTPVKLPNFYALTRTLTPPAASPSPRRTTRAPVRLRNYTIDDRFPRQMFESQSSDLKITEAEINELKLHYDRVIYEKGLSKISNNLSVYHALKNRSLSRMTQGFIRSCGITPRIRAREQIVAYYEKDDSSGIHVRTIYDPRCPDFDIQGKLDAIGPVVFLITFGYSFDGIGRMLLYKNLRFIEELNHDMVPLEPHESEVRFLLDRLKDIESIYENRPHSLSKNAYKRKYRSKERSLAY
ncbi:hypothetical protein IWQ61_006657 [Dispira simplex]|nr:hypothetical protein IWQ61_006657 [Dispira simplex]